LSVVDNARNALHIHVSASSERKECRKEIVAKKKQQNAIS
jgi:hypothetical protein